MAEAISVYEKIAGSGAKVMRVPVLVVSPTTASGALGTPAW
jgi:hypothetical protein